MRTLSTKPLIPMVLLTPLLAACGASEPSEADIRQAFEQQAEGVNGLIGGIAGGQKMEIISLTKHECKEQANSTGVICAFTIKMKVPLFGETEQTTEQSFIKGKDGWQILSP